MGWVSNGRAKVPASQTLMMSADPETILVPSLLKVTEVMPLLCALCFSALSSRDAAESMGLLRFERYWGGCQ